MYFEIYTSTFYRINVKFKKLCVWMFFMMTMKLIRGIIDVAVECFELLPFTPTHRT